MKPSIFLTQRVSETGIRLLRQHGELEFDTIREEPPSRQELIAGVTRNDYLYCLMSDQIDEEVMEANPNLKIIATMSIDAANVELKSANARKIPVTTIPPMVGVATADLVWMLLMAVARRIVPADRSFRAGVFHGAQSMYFLGSPIFGKTLGFIGFGRIGQAVAERSKGFRMPILYFDPHRLSPEREQELGARYAPMEEVLREADYVSLHPALTPDTRYLIRAPQLALMKPTAYLINTSRGPVVEEQALVDALRENRIAGAALDVYENEPHAHPALVTMENVVLSPHLGSAVGELRDEMAVVVANNVIAAIQGTRPPNLFNPEIYG